MNKTLWMRHFLLLSLLFLVSSVFANSNHTANPEKPETGIQALLDLLQKAQEVQETDPVQALKQAQQVEALNRSLKNNQVQARLGDIMGAIYMRKGDYQTAFPHYQQAVQAWKNENTPASLANSELNLGIIYWRLGDYDQAIKFCLNALRTYEQLKDQRGIANSLHNIGIINDLLKRYDTALEYHHRALKIRTTIQDQKGEAESYSNIGIIHYFSAQYEQALEYYQRSLKLRESIGDQAGVAKSLNNIGFIYIDLKNYQDALDYLKRALKIRKSQDKQQGNNYEIANISNNIGKLYLHLKDYPEAIKTLTYALKFAREGDYKDLIRENYELFSDVYIAQGNYLVGLDYYKLAAQVKDEIFNNESQEEISKLQTKYRVEKQQQEIEILKKDNQIQSLALDRQALQRNSLLGGLALIFILAFVLYNRYRFEKKSKLKLKSANDVIQLEKEKSDKLLLNILPKRVADDLKETGKTEPESFDNVTVYFSDIVGFTTQSAKLEPKYLIAELSDIFTNFDTIIEKNNGERVKTIGDAYLCVSGMPTANPDHAKNIVNSALEIMQYMHERNKTAKVHWEIRIGIHSGKVVGGVVGVKKYIYDVFGDSINTASRMESNSEPMHINISESTYHLVKDEFKIKPRGLVGVKGKGEMNMYFVEGKLCKTCS
ncbi:adenylate/guanylate cyclase domain-containing protein [Candidatus Venteria ishoeyi]|uniref:adenylate/guanylate cyclase domain-containing protein n=1 Tax=Candidatus Venteria ishoeyi TaxID=1899563 RepID=UPI0025A5A1C5|nr:adenylate/guanylate cyclase domain-containing protein [Candidatus Venteria ishoeyi]MDM8547659.1 adenylate/guanylate cyclase domain-containing protein [Candidatus Venteria ishoeyi]